MIKQINTWRAYIKQSKPNRTAVAIVAALMLVVSLSAASVVLLAEPAVAGNSGTPECVDNWCASDPDLSETARGDGETTSILPSDMDAIDLLVMAIWVMTAGIGVAAVGGIVWGAILYTTAGGSQEKTKKGIEIIRNVVVGLLLYVFMFAIINFLIPGRVIT